MGAQVAVNTPAKGKEAPGQETGRPGSGGEFMLQTLPAEGIPGWLLDDIFHFSPVSFLS